MPGRDQTGPAGMGVRTGRGVGNCSGNQPARSSYDGSQFFYGWGSRFGCGSGRRPGRLNMFSATRQPGWRRVDTLAAAPENETLILNNQVETLQSELESIKQRLAQFESTDQA